MLTFAAAVHARAALGRKRSSYFCFGGVPFPVPVPVWPPPPTPVALVGVGVGVSVGSFFLGGFLFSCAGTCSCVVDVVVVAVVVVPIGCAPCGTSVSFGMFLVVVVVAVVVVVVGTPVVCPAVGKLRPVVGVWPAATEVAPVLTCDGGCPPSDAAVAGWPKFCAFMMPADDDAVT
jgi:hypothetical protein